MNDCYIEQFNNCLHYVVDFIAEEPINKDDEQLGAEEVHNSFDIWITKYSIAGIEKAVTESGKWKIDIVVSGFAEDVTVFFNTEKAAKALHNWLVKWRYGV